MPYTDQGLPFAPRSQTSYQAAVEAKPSRATKTAIYRALITARPLTDHDAAFVTGWPLSTICSVRNGLEDVVPCGFGVSPYGKRVTKWGIAGRW